MPHESCVGHKPPSDSSGCNPSQSNASSTSTGPWCGKEIMPDQLLVQQHRPRTRRRLRMRPPLNTVKDLSRDRHHASLYSQSSWVPWFVGIRGGGKLSFAFPRKQLISIWHIHVAVWYLHDGWTRRLHFANCSNETMQQSTRQAGLWNERTVYLIILLSSWWCRIRIGSDEYKTIQCRPSSTANARNQQLHNHLTINWLSFVWRLWWRVWRFGGCDGVRSSTHTNLHSLISTHLRITINIFKW